MDKSPLLKKGGQRDWPKRGSVGQGYFIFPAPLPERLVLPLIIHVFWSSLYLPEKYLKGEGLTANKLNFSG
jgi:hypothetical protein